MQESTTLHFTLGLMCIFVNWNLPRGASVLLSKRYQFTWHSIFGAAFSFIHNFPESYHILPTSDYILFSLWKWKNNKQSLRECICVVEWTDKFWVYSCIHHNCLKSTWKQWTNFLSLCIKGGNFFAGAEKIRLSWWPFQYFSISYNISFSISFTISLQYLSWENKAGLVAFSVFANPIFLPVEVRGTPKADMSPHIPTSQTFRTFQFHFWKAE